MPRPSTTALLCQATPLPCSTQFTTKPNRVQSLVTALWIDLMERQTVDTRHITFLPALPGGKCGESQNCDDGASRAVSQLQTDKLLTTSCSGEMELCLALIRSTGYKSTHPSRLRSRVRPAPARPAPRPPRALSPQSSEFAAATLEKHRSSTQSICP